MFRECIICGDIIGEVGNVANGSITSGICDKCMIAIEQYRHYKRMLNTTGFAEYEELMDNALKDLHNKEDRKKEVDRLNKLYERR